VPDLRRRLERNVRLNRLTNCDVSGLAVSNAEGTSDFYVGPRDHTGVSSLRRLQDATATLTVSKARLDDVIPRNLNISLVKIDVEGSECHVLEGMQTILDRCHPDVIAEITPEYLAAVDRSSDDIDQLMTSHGYRAFAIEHDGLKPLANITDTAKSQFNALFTIG
jgi:FkbM family methyltransferase